jgi:pSer/pThr/pTyr-binding forkhead associated (FHA) protein
VADLRYIDDSGGLRVVHLGDEQVVIGRASTCQVVFPDELVSREHTRFERDKDGRIHVKDLGSRNKTFVNGQQITETILAPGDVLRVGEHVLEFLDDEIGLERLSLDFLTPDRKEPPGSEWIKTKAPLTLAPDQVAKLVSSLSFLGPTARAEEIAETALSRVILDLQAERGFIARRGGRKGEIVPIAHRGLSIQPGGSRMPVSQVFVSTSTLQQVAGRYPHEAGQIDPKAGYAATALVAPLVHRNDLVGVIYVDRATSSQPFSAMALQYIAAAGAAIGAATAEASRRLADARAVTETAYISVLRRMQTAAGAVPQAGEPFESAWKMQSGSLRCGDLTDLVSLDEGRCIFMLVDAGGGGVSGLSQGMAIRAAIRAAIGVAEDPMDFTPILRNLNGGVVANTSRQLVTCVVVGLDLATGRLSYVNAGGMPPLLLAGPGRLITLDQPALVLGVDPDYVYETASVDLPASFCVVCHTDGLTDTANAGGEVYGERRLHELLLARESLGEPAGLVEDIFKAVNAYTAGHARDDDATVLVLGKG